MNNDLEISRSFYEHVDTIARALGPDPKDQQPLENTAKQRWRPDLDDLALDEKIEAYNLPLG